ncbi:protein kinase domain-containing protein [Paludisphaera mucosa]|uniref:Serine/threonine-protein kinase n=1 Tax=Paludisphaera mucosa TaxID=3030827 RepID=A0ABT6FEN1_9BACT|nr:serine/threonine-protein kinase [Paludisphaera mucosa]MDG3005951.1 serine/threonine-protein kinase [Paludisphaera mucosa]
MPDDASVDDEDATGAFAPGGPGGPLAALAAPIGPLSRVHLPDAEAAGAVTPVVQPSSPEMPAPADRSARVQLLGEIARGGMGAVLKGCDPDLGRDLAVKVLLEKHRDEPDLIRRFVEEAQIAGQLQHPGVVPVYELGCFSDARPYFTMKLVKGRTLAQLLADRPTVDDDRPRFLAIFGQAAQTAAYAHARGVIHRDLKPSNVMVGSFGEVQVMDWGLAKVLPRGGAADDAAAGREAPPGQETVIATARSAADPAEDLSRAGSVLGTPSYMAPEQARGEVEDVDARADVFALGWILCEILTGRPAFTGRTSAEIQRKAARADLADASARLDACGADGELVELARACLAARADDRPSDAGVVADRLGTYLAGVEERLRAAELARAAEAARAEEALRTAEASEARARAERRARRTTAALAASVVALGVLSGGGAAWMQGQRALRAAAVNRAVNEALGETMRLRGVAQSAGPDPGRWEAALAEARRAADLLEQGEADASLRPRVEAALQFLRRSRDEAAALVERDRVDRLLLADLTDARLHGSTAHYEAFDDTYARAFRAAGIDVDRSPPEAVGAWIAARSRPAEIASYLDAWSIPRAQVGPKDGRRPKGHLIKAARLADPDPWRDVLRVGHLGDLAALRALADDAAGLERRSVVDLNLLILLLKSFDEARADRVRDIAWRLHPGDFWLNIELLHRHGEARPASPEQERWRLEDRLRYQSILLSMSPGPGGFQLLGDTLRSLGRRAEAVGAYREAIRRDPNHGEALVRLGPPLADDGEREEGLAMIRRAAHPGASAVTYFYVGNALAHLGLLEEAAEANCEAVRLDGDRLGSSIFNLGYLLRDLGRYEEAAETFRRASHLARAEDRPDQVRLAEDGLRGVDVRRSLVARLPGLHAGADRPKDDAELFELAGVFHDRGLNAAGARFFEAALGAAPGPRGSRGTWRATSSIAGTPPASRLWPVADEERMNRLRDRPSVNDCDPWPWIGSGISSGSAASASNTARPTSVGG